MILLGVQALLLLALLLRASSYLDPKKERGDRRIETDTPLSLAIARCLGELHFAEVLVIHPASTTANLIMAGGLTIATITSTGHMKDQSQHGSIHPKGSGH